MNAYNMLQLLRDQIGEGTASHWSDVDLVRKLNFCQRHVAILVQNYPGGWLQKSVNLTPVASVITLPKDCSKPVYLEETSSGNPIAWLGSVKQRRVSRRAGASIGYESYLEAYAQRNTLVVNQEGYVNEVTLWYDLRVPNMMTGLGATGTGAAALTFPNNANVKHIDDYYNGLEFMVHVGTGAGTVGDSITDYDGNTRTCVVTGTYSTSSKFGTISLLPEECHKVIVLEATILALAKPSSNIDEKVFQYYTSERKHCKKELNEWLETRIAGEGRVAITEEGI